MPSLRTGIEKLAVDQNPNAKRQRSGSPDIEAVLELPPLPAPVKDFAPYFSSAKDTPVPELLEPYHAYESELRKFYAQQPDDPVLKDGHINTVPIYAGTESSLKVRARNLEAETEAEKEKYILALNENDRRPDGSPAVVATLKEFQSNFNLFSESSLSELDWSNVVAAGSSVTTALLPVPKSWSGSKKTLREYYHDRLAPASDVDLFLYGLTEEEGLEKIKHIETTVKDSILHEVTTIRTKNAITIASQYPTRHVQIVLRLYDSISQIITGFDVDCACVAYDGKEVYGSPRALAAFSTQTNTIDLTRRSPSYESRLSKYSHRGFEVHWPDLDRSRIDPTIFERAFRKTLGLSRLLVLEKLPSTTDRERYTDERRKERGRPAVDRRARDQHKIFGNIKDEQEDEVADWAEEDQVSNYHTMVVPYGKKFTARKIERLLYTKDLLLNSEWNRPKDREVNLHRHPCFFGTVEDVMGDCCGFCPVPKTDEEIEVAEQESKLYISGSLTFVKDDPGRQEIGSFNPITTDDWTEMAYVGNTQMLCQAIVDGDINYITSWCEQEGNDVNTRDYVGRAPLHLAVINGKADIVKILVDNGAKIIARLLDGRCALHIAAQLGHTDIVKILMDKSLANEEEEAEKEDKLRAAKLAAKKSKDGDEEMVDAGGSDSEGSGMEVESDDDSDDDSETQGFTKVKEPAPGESNEVPEDDDDEPDFYDINVVAWDLQCTALHFAIMGGHIPVIRLLVSEYGADVLLPIKFGTGNSNQAILSTILATVLPTEKAKEVISTLLQLGATSAQADTNHYTALHYIVHRNNVNLMDIFIEKDGPAAKSVMNLVTMENYQSAKTMVSMAIKEGGDEMLNKLLSLGAKPTISYEDFLKCYFAKNEYAKNNQAEQNLKIFKTTCSQPIILAAVRDLPEMVAALVANGADPSTPSIAGQESLTMTYNYNSTTATNVLDIVRKRLETLREYKKFKWPANKVPTTMNDEAYYLKGLKPGTYKYWTALNRYKVVKAENDEQWVAYLKSCEVPSGFDAAVEVQMAAVQSLKADYEELEETLIKAGAKTFKEAHPGAHIKYNEPVHQLPYQSPTTDFDPYETYFTFSVPQLDDHHKEGYFRLFEAVWSNDIDEVKALTLQPWKSEDGQEHPALQIAVQDTVNQLYNYGNRRYGNYNLHTTISQRGFTGVSPFSLAVLRGPSHYKLAKAIVEIALAQYEPQDHEGGKSKWRIEYDQEGYCSDHGSECGDSEAGSEIRIHSELVDEVFTIDNVAALSTVIKSRVKPMEMLQWHCSARWFIEGKEKPEDDIQAQRLVQHAIVDNDIKLLGFLFQIAEEQAVHFPNEPVSPIVTLTQDSFDHAIRLGRTSILGEMIKRTGVGIPLDDLVKTSGIKLPEEKPEYYQGLNVGGKKNARWAQAGNPNGGHYVHKARETTPPLLKAARFGNLESVQWFLSDIPTTKYLEFAAANQNDKRVAALSKSDKGFNDTAAKWLSMRHEILLHLAVMTMPSDDGLADHLSLIQYIASIDASLLESRSLGGFTPLHLACTRRAKEDIALLISLGSKVRSRDSTGRNMMHHLICAKDKPEWKEGESLDTFLSLFEKSDVTEMLLERDILGYTPFAFWQSECGNANNEITHASTVPETVSAYTDGQHLTIMNSVGDLPLHVAIKQGRPLHVREFIAQNPQTLGRENATGITALELAQQKLASAALEGIRTSLLGSNRYSGRNNETAVLGVETFDWHEFEPKEPVPEDKRERMKAKLLKGDMQSFETHRWVSEECLEAVERLEAAGETLKRRLVPLGEANEVARRMVVAQKKDEQWRIQQYHFNSTDEDGWEHKLFDEVSAAMSSRAEQGWVLRGRAVVNIV
ncbi:hypothetical protein V495_06954 [Pseudogymnoascus sp. VKM F-4514 (FW-929)]|nr:hypothetical protein V495_06954 [Pseudogymnoascus sp. VKM F-4514 (FW-929)]KFY51889.1 hypothetical protein V497_08777 [Pseudogymnoascus sp. VKM F-4516 (FW-969)]